jgi:hypothetical protein
MKTIAPHQLDGDLLRNARRRAREGHFAHAGPRPTAHDAIGLDRYAGRSTASYPPDLERGAAIVAETIAGATRSYGIALA